MPESAMTAEPVIRLSAFFGILLLMAGWEALLPRRSQSIGRSLRWPNNLALVVLDTLIVRLLFPFAAVGMAFLAQAKGWGLIHIIALPAWLVIPSAVLLLDLIIYGQHVAFHAVPQLWRLHRMHHADLEFDVTTGLRFHPVEIVLSMLIKLTAVIILGAPPLAVLAFEVLLNATSMFNHANLRLSPATDRVVRWLLVTPDMHRVHHSVDRTEADSNYGFNVPWWDHLFGTYRAQPRHAHETMALGVGQFGEAREQRIDRLLTQPFR